MAILYTGWDGFVAQRHPGVPAALVGVRHAASNQRGGHREAIHEHGSAAQFPSDEAFAQDAALMHELLDGVADD